MLPWHAGSYSISSVYLARKERLAESGIKTTYLFRIKIYGRVDTLREDLKIATEKPAEFALK